MAKIRTMLLACATLISMGMNTQIVGATPSKIDLLALDATPVTTEKLFKLYYNRSWLWSDGAGYFPAKKRQFMASTGKGRKSSYAVGSWFLTDPGKLCFKAEWHSASGAAPALTCFSHREADGTIYQRREPDGKWYVFKNTPQTVDNEYSKVRHGDYVTSRLNKAQKRTMDGD